MTTGRGQSGLDRLVLFVLLLVAILAVTPPALQFAADIDVREPPPETPEPPKLVVLGSEGTAIDENRTAIGAVRVVVANTGEAETDMAAFSATWVGNGTYELVSARSKRTADGTFTVARLDGSASGTVLADVSDRGVLTFDLGTDDVDGADEFGTRLQPGDTASVTITTDEGVTVTETFVVPGQLPANGSLAL